MLLLVIYRNYNNEKVKYESLCGNCYIKKVVDGVNEDVI